MSLGDEGSELTALPVAGAMLLEPAEVVRVLPMSTPLDRLMSVAAVAVLSPEPAAVDATPCGELAFLPAAYTLGAGLARAI